LWYGGKLSVAVEEELGVEHLRPDFLVADFARPIKPYVGPEPATFIPFLHVLFQVHRPALKL
jgi:hypothetical protein